MKETVIKISLCMVALISVAVLFAVVGYIFLKGIQVISLDFLLKPPNYTALEKGGIFPHIIGSLCLLAVCLLFAVPLGIASGIYLAEYATENIVTKSGQVLCGMLSRDTINSDRLVRAYIPRLLSWFWSLHVIRWVSSWIHDSPMDGQSE